MSVLLEKSGGLSWVAVAVGLTAAGAALISEVAKIVGNSDDYMDSVELVYDALDYNNKNYTKPDYIVYNKEQVLSAMNSYINMCLAKQIPEYILDNAENEKEICTKISTNALLPAGIVRRVLYQWYWYTKRRDIKSLCYLYPYTCKKNSEEGKSVADIRPPDTLPGGVITPKQEGNENDSEPTILDKIGNIFSSATTLIVVAGIVYVAFVIYNKYKESELIDKKISTV